VLVELIMLGCGGALLSGGVGWRVRAHHQERDALRSALADPGPDRRSAALVALGKRGMGSDADLVLELARSETNPAVLGALTDAVCRNQWEPADNPALVELRHHVLELLDDARTPAPTRPRPPAAADTPTDGEGVATLLLDRVSTALGEDVIELRIFDHPAQQTPTVVWPPGRRPPGPRARIGGAA